MSRGVMVTEPVTTQPQHNNWAESVISQLTHTPNMTLTSVLSVPTQIHQADLSLVTQDSIPVALIKELDHTRLLPTPGPLAFHPHVLLQWHRPDHIFSLVIAMMSFR